MVLNFIAFKVTKSYFSKSGYQEVEVLTENSQNEHKPMHILSWTYELFKSFRSMNNH